MFGALVGHLAKARALLDRDSRLIRRQEEAKGKAADKNKEGGRRLMQKEEENLAKGKRRVRALRLREDAVGLEIKAQRSIDYHTHLGAFLVTKAGPPVFWMPASHNETTHTLLETRKLRVAALVSGLQRKSQKEIAELKARAVLVERGGVAVHNKKTKEEDDEGDGHHRHDDDEVADGGEAATEMDETMTDGGEEGEDDDDEAAAAAEEEEDSCSDSS